MPSHVESLVPMLTGSLTLLKWLNHYAPCNPNVNVCDKEDDDEEEKEEEEEEEKGKEERVLFSKHDSMAKWNRCSP